MKFKTIKTRNKEKITSEDAMSGDEAEQRGLQRSSTGSSGGFPLIRSRLRFDPITIYFIIQCLYSCRHTCC